MFVRYTLRRIMNKEIGDTSGPGYFGEVPFPGLADVSTPGFGEIPGSGFGDVPFPGFGDIPEPG